MRANIFSSDFFIFEFKYLILIILIQKFYAHTERHRKKGNILIPQYNKNNINIYFHDFFPFNTENMIVHLYQKLVAISPNLEIFK